MARGDRRGPEGLGPGTGRGAGYCSGGGIPGYMNRGGRGCRRSMGFASHPVPVDEREMLMGEAEFLKRNLEALNGRLAELRKRS